LEEFPAAGDDKSGDEKLDYEERVDTSTGLGGATVETGEEIDSRLA
jgi:hypothetical protein